LYSLSSTGFFNRQVAAEMARKWHLVLGTFAEAVPDCLDIYGCPKHLEICGLTCDTVRGPFVEGLPIHEGAGFTRETRLRAGRICFALCRAKGMMRYALIIPLSIGRRA
jgi:hypothetical protein